MVLIILNVNTCFVPDHEQVETFHDDTAYFLYSKKWGNGNSTVILGDNISRTIEYALSRNTETIHANK